MEDVGGSHRLPSGHFSRDFGGAKEGLREPRGREGHELTQHQKMTNDPIIKNGKCYSMLKSMGSAMALFVDV